MISRIDVDKIGLQQVEAWLEKARKNRMAKQDPKFQPAGDATAALESKLRERTLQKKKIEKHKRKERADKLKALEASGRVVERWTRSGTP